METNGKKQKIIKVVVIVFAVLMVILLALVAFSRRPQSAGKGNISASDFNARIEYKDEMNCRVGDKKADSTFTLAAKDGWTEVSLRNYELKGQKTDVTIVGDYVYIKTDSESKIYNLKYFAQEYELDYPKSFAIELSDDRKIHCSSQNQEMYKVENIRSFDDQTWREATNEK